jgi:uncharacterized protein YkwD
MPRKFALSIALLVAAAPAVSSQSKPIQNIAALNTTVARAELIDARPRTAAPRVVEVPAAVEASTASIERRAFDILNQKRVECGLTALAWSEQVAAVARLHSRNMADQGFFSHIGKDGGRVGDRADRLKLGDWRAIGENLAYNRGFPDPVAKAVESWLTSNSHRASLLSGDWSESAVGVAIAADGSYYFTQVFLVRK